MLRELSDRIHRLSTGRVAAAALLLFVLFTALVLPGQASSSAEATGEVGSPDLSFYYSADELYQMAERYGEDGREEYIRTRFSFDLVWPLVYGSFLCIAISWTFRKVFLRESVLQRANLVPVLAVGLDYMENLSTSLVMARYPSSTTVIDWLASLFTMAKWILVAGSFALLLAGFVAGGVRRLRARNSA